MDWSIKTGGMRISNGESPVNMLAKEAAKTEAAKRKLEVYKQARELAELDLKNGTVTSQNFVNRVADYVKELSC